jgi:hypothetical protein
MIALTWCALKHSSSSQKSRGGSIHLSAEDLDGSEPGRCGLAPPEVGVVAGSGRIDEGPNAYLSLEHLVSAHGAEPKDSDRPTRQHHAARGARA